jgi:hypothetical protein
MVIYISLLQNIAFFDWHAGHVAARLGKRAQGQLVEPDHIFVS